MTRMTTLHGIPQLQIAVMSDGAPVEGGGQNVHHHAQTTSMGPTCTAVQKTGLIYQKNDASSQKNSGQLGSKTSVY